MEGWGVSECCLLFKVHNSWDYARQGHLLPWVKPWADHIPWYLLYNYIIQHYLYHFPPNAPFYVLLFGRMSHLRSTLSQHLSCSFPSSSANSIIPLRACSNSSLNSELTLLLTQFPPFNPWLSLLLTHSLLLLFPVSCYRRPSDTAPLPSLPWHPLPISCFLQITFPAQDIALLCATFSPLPNTAARPSD